MRKMKDSGIDWIGEIPEEWEIEAISRVFSQRNVKVSDFEYAPLSVTKQGVVPQLDSAAKSDDHSNRKLVKRGDFVINSRSDRKMSAGISQYDGSVSLINLVMKPMDDKLQTDFIGYLMKNYGFAEEFYRWGSGIVADLWSTNWERARKIQLPLPPSPEQEKIAQFLDRKTALIDDIIKDTKTSIEELKAYKQSLITEIVTKGLDPTVKLVPSGIEWVGDVPEGWKVVKSRYFLREVSIKGYTNEEVLSLYRDYGIVPKNSRSDNHNVTSLDTSGYKFIRPGNLVINKMKAWQGSMAISNIQGIVSPAYYIFEVDSDRFDLRFLHYALRNPIYKQEYMRISAGLRIGQWDLNKNEFKNLKYAYPISIEEQKKVADYLDQKTAQIDALIAEKENLIREYETYKKSMIYEYVTGKKQVGANEG
ncbi:TPA: restriction endonuclease subunit S [Streptococcus equi subsp. zooepidemicus]|nr:restriction endonuclease subunit S [Streptococcus equi subsp. zooepidemicus]HEL0781000.1 restriction endonuclease subunit S [Streptococcus equi subsp. zooepidemicus]HEL1121255.1 restriction endonuclease subunit S [Streptococcus equi subsp. zooepidemicus]HEL1154242.1 restriction endonuclease subunit S [Streptococcus equi subsp. zooepidemicus]HEL1165870.1 restriction endonuclease subunit S [Streptococcus equi subsp. zooepidemicus]